MTSSLPWLSLIVFLPLIGAVLCLLVTAESARWLALAFTVADVLCSLPLWWLFDPSTAGMQFVERASWIASPPVQYSLGLDGISFPPGPDDDPAHALVRQRVLDGH